MASNLCIFIRKMNIDYILGLFLGIGLAASVGFRVFVPLFVLSLASYFELVTLNENWEWIGGTSALILLGIATLVEFLAYLIPILDHFLDTIALPLATIAGTVIVVATSIDMNPVFLWTLAIIAGGGTATAVKGVTASTRLVSTVNTGGAANPFVSILETGTSLVISTITIFLPIIGFLLVLTLFFYLRRVYRFVFSKKRKTI